MRNRWILPLACVGAALGGLALVPLVSTALQDEPEIEQMAHMPEARPENSFFGLNIVGLSETKRGEAIVATRPDQFTLRVRPQVHIGLRKVVAVHRFQLVVTLYQGIPGCCDTPVPKPIGRWTGPIMELGPGDDLVDVIEDTYPIQPGEYVVTVGLVDLDDVMIDHEKGVVTQGTELATTFAKLIVPAP